MILTVNPRNYRNNGKSPQYKLKGFPKQKYQDVVPIRGEGEMISNMHIYTTLYEVYCVSISSSFHYLYSTSDTVYSEQTASSSTSLQCSF